MKCKTAPSPAASSKPDPRLASVLATREGRYTAWVQHGSDRVLVDLIKTGAIEHKARRDEALTDDEQAVYEALLQTSTGESSTRGIVLADAARAYAHYCAHQVRHHGGEIITETFRSGHLVEQSVQRFPAPRRDAPRPRARGTGKRPKGQSTRSSGRARDSGDDGESSEPPGARPCAECGQPVEPNSRGRPREYCKDCSTPAARKRRERENDRRHPERVVEREGEIWSLAPECSCGSEAAAPDYVLGYYRCVPCGLKRPELEARILDYRAGEDPLHARSFVPAHGPKKRTPRFGDYKRKPVTLKKRLSSGEVVPV